MSNRGKKRKLPSNPFEESTNHSEIREQLAGHPPKRARHGDHEHASPRGQREVHEQHGASFISMYGALHCPRDDDRNGQQNLRGGDVAIHNDVRDLPGEGAIHHNVRDLPGEGAIHHDVRDPPGEIAIQHDVRDLPGEGSVHLDVHHLPGEIVIQHDIRDLPGEVAIQHAVQDFPAVAIYESVELQGVGDQHAGAEQVRVRTHIDEADHDMGAVQVPNGIADDGNQVPLENHAVNIDVGQLENHEEEDNEDDDLFPECKFCVYKSQPAGSFDLFLKHR